MFLPIQTFTGTLVFVFICSHYANLYNNFSFNISNLAAYVYTAVKLPVLILNETGDVMLCNSSIVYSMSDLIEKKTAIPACIQGE